MTDSSTPTPAIQHIHNESRALTHHGHHYGHVDSSTLTVTHPLVCEQGVTIVNPSTFTIGSSSYTEADFIAGFDPTTISSGDATAHVDCVGSSVVEVKGSLVPETASTSDVGSLAKPLNKVWTDDLQVNGILQHSSVAEVEGTFVGNNTHHVDIPYTKTNAYVILAVKVECVSVAANSTAPNYFMGEYLTTYFWNVNVPLSQVKTVYSGASGFYPHIIATDGFSGNIRIEVNPENGFTQDVNCRFRVSTMCSHTFTLGTMTITDTGVDFALTASPLAGITNFLEVRPKKVHIITSAGPPKVMLDAPAPHAKTIEFLDTGVAFGQLATDASNNMRLETLNNNLGLTLATHGNGAIDLDRGGTTVFGASTSRTHVSFGGNWVVDATGSSTRLLRAGNEIIDGSATSTDVSVNGTVVLEMSTSDVTVTGDVLPKTDSLYDLGSSSLQWAEAHIDTGNIDTVNYITLNDVSDRRVKKDIRRLEGSDAVTQLCQLEPVYFTRKDIGVKKCGLIAQDVEKVFKDNYCSPVRIINQNGEKGEPLIGLDYTQFIPHIIASVQEMAAKIVELENKMMEKDKVTTFLLNHVKNLADRLEVLEHGAFLKPVEEPVSLKKRKK